LWLALLLTLGLALVATTKSMAFFLPFRSVFPVIPGLVAVVVVAEEEVLVWFVEEAEAEEYGVCCHVEAPALEDDSPTSCNIPESSSRDKMLSAANVGSSS
jgi:hypothetical protein